MGNGGKTPVGMIIGILVFIGLVISIIVGIVSDIEFLHLLF